MYETSYGFEVFCGGFCWVEGLFSYLDRIRSCPGQRDAGATSQAKSDSSSSQQMLYSVSLTSAAI